MERSQFQVQTPPQVVTISVDPLVQGTMQALAQSMNTVVVLLQELHREIADSNAMLRRAMETQMAADAFTNQLATALGGVPDSMQFTAPGAVGVVQTAEDALTQPTLPEGHLIAATDPNAIASGMAVQPLAAVPTIDVDSLDWFVGKDGAYFVHGTDGGPDRRATPQENAAIKADVGSSRGRKRR